MNVATVSGRVSDESYIQLLVIFIYLGVVVCCAYMTFREEAYEEYCKGDKIFLFSLYTWICSFISLFFFYIYFSFSIEFVLSYWIIGSIVWTVGLIVLEVVKKLKKSEEKSEIPCKDVIE